MSTVCPTVTGLGVLQILTGGKGVCIGSTIYLKTFKLFRNPSQNKGFSK
jgi:hypothetical protein